MIGTGFLFLTHWDKQLKYLLVKHQKKLMYDLLYVKKRRRRRIAALVSLISGIGITSLVITSFLGRTVGTFSVSIANSSVKLSLSEKESFDNATSYLRIDNIYPFEEFHYRDLPSEDVLDNEITRFDDANALGYDDNGNAESIYYLKYTFYVKNSGNTTARYSLSLNLTDRTKTHDGTERMLDDTVRIMVFENTPGEERTEPKIYAKEAAGNNHLKNGDITRREFVGYNSIGGYEDDTHPLAETFKTPETICTYDVSNFTKNSLKRYTIVIWLEGEDPQSDEADEAPVDAKLKFGVEIRAYEEA